MIHSWLKNAIIIIVVIVWAANFAAGMFLPNYEADPAINTVFMAIVGGLFALGSRDKTPSDKDEGS